MWPQSLESVTVTLPATTDRGAASVICTPDGRPLPNANAATVRGPVGISVGRRGFQARVGSLAGLNHGSLRAEAREGIVSVSLVTTGAH